jgi:putative transferase (TIGR04331 family)
MVKVILVTTALEETWGENIPVVFLGEWCKLHRNKAKWQDLESITCKYHWDDRSKLFEDYMYLNQLYEELLEDLGDQLNEIHAIEYPKKAWRILLGPWLSYFIQILFDRWYMIQYAVDTNANLQAINLDIEPHELTPNDMSHFHRLFIEDKWNHFIYTSILQEFPSVELVTASKLPRSTPDALVPLSFSSKAKRFIKSVYNKTACFINGENAGLFVNTYLSRKDDLILSLKFNQLPILQQTDQPEIVKRDETQRRWKMKSEGKSAFEVFTMSMIPKQIPTSYLEGFTTLLDKADAMSWPKRPKVIFTSNSFSSDDIFKIYAARNAGRSVPLIVGQHGGHYGIGKFFANEIHEIKIADRFLSWGWTSPTESKIKRIGQLIAKKTIVNTIEQKTNLLLVTTTVPRYSYFLYSVPISSQWINYFEDQSEFVGQLDHQVQASLIVRLFKNDLHWNQLKRWKERFPGLIYDEGLGSMKKHIATCRIFVSTYNATTYLESLTLGIPTVIFWNPEHSEIRASAIPYFKDLQSVGIFHESPQSAALHINAVWNDVDSWWNCQVVKDVIARFTDNFCYVSERLVESIENELKDSVIIARMSDGGHK